MKSYKHEVIVHWGDTDPASVTIKGAHPLDNPPIVTERSPS